MAPFQYAWDARLQRWVVLLDGIILAWFITEQEAADYCDRENSEEKNQDPNNDTGGQQ